MNVTWFGFATKIYILTYNHKNSICNFCIVGKKRYL